MQSIVLDTDAASRLFRGRLSTNLQEQLRGKLVFVTFVTVAEFHKGMNKASWGERRRRQLEDWLTRRPILPYDSLVSLTWGRIAAKTELAGNKIGDNDLWIGACCLTDNLPLMTLNRRHFDRIEGLNVISE